MLAIGFFGYLFYLGGPYYLPIKTIWWGLCRFSAYWPVLGLVMAITLLWGHLRHRSWRFYLPLVLPIAVIAGVDTNFSLPPNWFYTHRSGFYAKNEYRLSSGSLSELALHLPNWDPARKQFYMRDYLKGKKLVASYHYGFVRNVLFEILVPSEVKIKEYPHVLSEDEYYALKKKHLKSFTYFNGYRVNFYLEHNGNFPQAETVYVVSYRQDTYLIPEDYFMQLKRLTKADLEKYKGLE